MVYPIYVYGSAVLRNPTESVGNDFPDLKQLIDDMFATMQSSSGVGLAAPQIGKSLRIFVVDTTPMADADSPELAGFRKAFINPEIYEYSDVEVLMGEGCLSLPGMNEDVYRPETIRIRYQDVDFEWHDEFYDDYRARVIQHEYDHLEGKVYTDHLSPLRKTLLRNKLNAMAKGKYSADYRTKLK